MKGLDSSDKLSPPTADNGYHVPQEYQDYSQGTSSNPNQQFVGEVITADNDNGWITVEVKNRFARNDEMMLITSHGNHSFTLKAMDNKTGGSINCAPVRDTEPEFHCRQNARSPKMATMDY